MAASGTACILPSRAVLPLFAVTLYISAGLMFLAEPMVAKMVLPQFGGSPAVWSTCLVFFQATLLLGYAYAHALTRVAPRRAQILIHVAVLLPLGALSLPLNIGANLAPQGVWPALSLLVRLVLVAGPVVFAISATAPLLQSWFCDLDHETARDPYFLYASSNAGSLLALLSYPFLVEPALQLHQQAALWSWGFGILAAGIALSGGVTFFSTRSAMVIAPPDAAEPLQWRERLVWAVLALVPSSLLLGVTSYITTDVASAPLLWVVPLAIYLLTFILVFARRPPLPHAVMVRLMPFVLIPLVLTMAPGLQVPFFQVLILHLGGLFIVAMVCHGELARRRPSSERLTDFYFCLSIGGVLGGMFNALLAPVIFPDVWEYPIALVVVCLIRPATPEDSGHSLAWDIVLPLGLFAIVFLARRLFPGTDGSHLLVLTTLFGMMVPGIALLSFWPRRVRFAAGVAAYLVASAAADSGDTITITTDRSFFGVSRVEIVNDRDGRYLVLFRGTTMHGVKSLAPGEETVPMAYYSHEGPFGRFFAALPVGQVHHVGVIGLGTGELACYAAPGQDWTFYEIDPLAKRIADDPRYFQFLENCGNHPHVVIGDARLTIAGAPDAFYDVLVLDAFSSDSIPMHLMTREAVALYLRKLAPNGRMLFHISSRNLDLRQVVGTLAADAGLVARLGSDTARPRSIWRHTPAVVVAMARDSEQLVGVDQAHGWQTLPAGAQRFLWTDQRSDLLRVILFGQIL
jgi:spermidine synthase